MGPIRTEKERARKALGAFWLSLLLAFSPLASAKGADLPEPALGCLLPLSGRLAPLGNKALDAIVMAAGLFHPERQSGLRLLVEDTRSDPKEAAAGVERLHLAGVTGIVGPLGSAEAGEAAKEAQRLKIPLIVLTGREGITEEGDFIFRNFPTAGTQVRALVFFAQADLGLKHFSLLYPGDSYGREMARLFRGEVIQRGGKIVQDLSYDPQEADLAAFASLLGVTDGRQADFEALFIPDRAERAAIIISGLAPLLPKGVRFLGTSAWNSPVLLGLDENILQRAYFVDLFFPESTRPEVSRFVEEYFLAYGRQPEAIEALAYDAAAMAVQVLLGQGKKDREGFRHNLADFKDYAGVTGRTSFLPSREALKEPFILTVKDGQIVQAK